MKNVVIFGTDENAARFSDLLVDTGKFNVVAFTEERGRIRFNKIKGFPVIPFEELEFKTPPEDFSLFFTDNEFMTDEKAGLLLSVARIKAYNILFPSDII